MSALTRLRTGEIALSQPELDSRFRARVSHIPIAERDNWVDPDNGPRKHSSEYPIGSWQHALLSRDEGNPEPLRAYRAKRGAAK